MKSGYPVMSADWKIDVLKEQVLTSVRRIDEYRGILHSRRHLAASPVFKGIPNFRETRIAMLRAETVDELFAILERAGEAGYGLKPGGGKITLRQPENQSQPNEKSFG